MPREIAKSKQNFEFAFNYYYFQFLNNKLDIKKDFERKLNNIFLPLYSKIKIPKSIIERNPGISSITQLKLLEYFEDYRKDIRNLIPVYPEDEYTESYHFFHEAWN